MYLHAHSFRQYLDDNTHISNIELVYYTLNTRPALFLGAAHERPIYAIPSCSYSILYLSSIAELFYCTLHSLHNFLKTVSQIRELQDRWNNETILNSNSIAFIPLDSRFPSIYKTI